MRKNINYSVICGIIFLCVVLSLFVLALGNGTITLVNHKETIQPIEKIRTHEIIRVIEPQIIEHTTVYNISNTYYKQGIDEEVIEHVNKIINNRGK